MVNGLGLRDGESSVAVFERKVEVAAPVEVARNVLTDVERWPEWTASIERIECRTPLPLSIGARVWIKQPKLMPAVWTITRWDELNGFTWESRHFGLQVLADHRLTPTATGCTLELRLCYAGLLGPLVGWLGGGITNRYLDLEATGFQRRCAELSPPR